MHYAYYPTMHVSFTKYIPSLCGAYMNIESVIKCVKMHISPNKYPTLSTHRGIGIYGNPHYLTIYKYQALFDTSVTKEVCLIFGNT